MLILIFFVVGVGFAYDVVYTSGFSPIPAYVKCYSGFSTGTMSAVHNACVAWNGTHSSALVYRNTATHSNTTFPLENNTNEITKGYRGTGEGTYLMRTQYTQRSIVTETIYEADIDINVSYNWGTSSTSLDTQTSITHEIGHLLGLGESEVTSAIMYGEQDYGEVRTITNDDIAGIAEIYGG